jgi:hypothetical protein
MCSIFVSKTEHGCVIIKHMKDNTNVCSRCHWRTPIVNERMCDTCKPKWRALQKRYQQKALAQKYGLSVQELGALVINAQGVCPICLRSDRARFVVDHDHEQGKPRGILCSRCNTGLGQFDDNPTLLRRALKYLTR